MKEAEFQRKVIELCNWLQLRTYHTFDSRRSAAGFPDLVIVGNRVIYAELKAEKGTVSPQQEAWLKALREAGTEAYLWRPSNWDRIELVLKGLKKDTVRA